jgi:hypothetical protein
VPRRIKVRSDVAKLLQLPEIQQKPDGTWPRVEFGLGWHDFVRMWQMILFMAVRDKAESIHYHPWRTDGRLSYIIKQSRHALHPPPESMCWRVAAAAGAMLCGNRLSAATRRWLGWPVGTSGRIRCTCSHGPSIWAGAVWSSGLFLGVEWYRIDQKWWWEPDSKVHN